jgi:hypothetical protein
VKKIVFVKEIPHVLGRGELPATSADSQCFFSFPAPSRFPNLHNCPIFDAEFTCR